MNQPVKNKYLIPQILIFLEIIYKSWYHALFIKLDTEISTKENNFRDLNIKYDPNLTVSMEKAKTNNNNNKNHSKLNAQVTVKSLLYMRHQKQKPDILICKIK
jgi:hypothetical protein